MNQITDLNDLRVFAAVIDNGSFTAATRALGTQTSKLSRRVRALEEELQVRLLNRTSRSLSLTETGRSFYQHCLAVVAGIEGGQRYRRSDADQPAGRGARQLPVGIAELRCLRDHFSIRRRQPSSSGSARFN